MIRIIATLFTSSSKLQYSHWLNVGVSKNMLFLQPRTCSVEYRCMILNCFIRIHLEANSHFLFYGRNSALLWRDWGNPQTKFELRQLLFEPMLEGKIPEFVVGLLSRWTVNFGDRLLLHALIFFFTDSINLQKSEHVAWILFWWNDVEEFLLLCCLSWQVNFRTSILFAG
jgi:hypothetical protein